MVKSEHHTVNSKFHQNHCVTHKKGRKVPIHLQPTVKIELQQLLNEGQIEKLTNCSDQFFISPIVITVKKDQSIKIDLDSKILNKTMHKKVPDAEYLLAKSNDRKNTVNSTARNSFFTTLDLQYAYSQLNLHSDTARHCNFNLVNGDMTGTYHLMLNKIISRESSNQSCKMQFCKR